MYNIHTITRTEKAFRLSSLIASVFVLKQWKWKDTKDYFNEFAFENVHRIMSFTIFFPLLTLFFEGS